MQKILIIDDEESIRFGFKEHLSREGYDVLTAEDYDSAIAAIDSTKLDLIISDIILEHHTGMDILREVKTRPMNYCPVVMVTGRPDVETASEAVRLGAFDYLPKPVRKATLLRTVSLALNHKALVDEKARLQAEKEQYRRKLEAIFRSLRDAIITVDRDMCVIEANKEVRNICGLSSKKITGIKFDDDSDQCGRACRKIIEKTLKTKKTVKDFPIDCHRKKRRDQVVLLTSSLLKDKDKNVMGAVLVARDITRINTLEKELKERHRFHGIIGKSKNMQQIYSLLEDLSDTETTVLITGESGTGKEVVARALHFSSARAGRPLVEVNCSVLSENLLESELFGHVKGAFTGAIKDTAGKFERADTGTVFLDEIGDISPAIQVKLLRFLQERKYEKVGGSKVIEADVRIIVATNRNLQEKIKKGGFREDLYYRLNVVEIVIQPLRERREDIPLLVRHFHDVFNDRLNRSVGAISDDVMDIFMRYKWPGNVRELENAMEHAFVLCHDRIITADHLPAAIRKGKRIKYNARGINHPEERLLIVEALTSTGGNKAKAARSLGMSRQNIYRKIKKYNITSSS